MGVVTGGASLLCALLAALGGWQAGQQQSAVVPGDSPLPAVGPAVEVECDCTCEAEKAAASKAAAKLAALQLKDYGDHLPKQKINSNIYILEKL